MKIEGVLIRLMKQNFSESKRFTQIISNRVFSGVGGRVEILGTKVQGVKILDLFKSLDFQQLSYFQHFEPGVKIYQIFQQGNMAILVDIFAIPLQYV